MGLPWTELTQAKWNTRRMLGNLGMDIESSVFGLVEMPYTFGPINRLNFKGIMKSDASLRVIRPKIAYYAIQNLTSVFDHSLERIRTLEHSRNISGAAPDAHAYDHSSDRALAVFGYRHQTSGKQVYTFWQPESIPVDASDASLNLITLRNGNFDNPVWVDIITGAVHVLAAEKRPLRGAVGRVAAVEPAPAQHADPVQRATAWRLGRAARHGRGRARYRSWLADQAAQK